MAAELHHTLVLNNKDKGGQNERREREPEAKKNLWENGEHSNREPEILRQSNKMRREMSFKVIIIL